MNSNVKELVCHKETIAIDKLKEILGLDDGRK